MFGLRVSQNIIKTHTSPTEKAVSHRAPSLCQSFRSWGGGANQNRSKSISSSDFSRHFLKIITAARVKHRANPLCRRRKKFFVSIIYGRNSKTTKKGVPKRSGRDRSQSGRKTSFRDIMSYGSRPTRICRGNYSKNKLDLSGFSSRSRLECVRPVTQCPAKVIHLRYHIVPRVSLKMTEFRILFRSRG